MARIVITKPKPRPATTFKDAVRAVGDDTTLELTAEELVTVVAVLTRIGGNHLSARPHIQTVFDVVQAEMPQVDFIKVFHDIGRSNGESIYLRDLEN